MSGSCPQCHAAVVPGMRTCQFCGAPVEYIEPPAEESTPAETPAPEDVPKQSTSATLSSAAAPAGQVKGQAKGKRKRSPLFVVAQVGVGLAVLAFFYFAVAHVLYFVPGAVRGGGPSSGVTPQSSGYAPSSASAADLGVDIYPGARAQSGTDRVDAPDRTAVSAAFVTDDAMDKVVEFYRTRMIGQAAIYANGDAMVISISPNAQESIVVTIAPAQSGGKTGISISRTTNKN